MPFSLACRIDTIPVPSTELTLRSTIKYRPAFGAVHSKSGALESASERPIRSWVVASYTKTSKLKPGGPCAAILRDSPSAISKEVGSESFNAGLTILLETGFAVWPGKEFGWESVAKARKRLPKKCRLKAPKNGTDRV